MKGKQLLILVAAAAILITAAVYTSRDTYKKLPSRLGKLIFPDLPANEITEIIIEKENDSLTLARVNDIWICRDKQDYPVKYERIKETVIKIAALKMGQIPTINETQRTRMGIVAPPQAGSGTLIKMKGAGSEEIASLLIGNSRQSTEEANFRGFPEGTFVSADLGKTAYLVKESFHHATVEPNGWLITELLNVPEEDIERISIQSHGGNPLVLSVIDGTMTVEGLKNNEISVDSAGSTLRSALSSLHLDDIAEANLSDKKMGLDKPLTYTAETSKGEIYKIQIGGSPGAIQEKYIRLSAELKPLPPKEEVNTDKPDLSEEEKQKAQTENDTREIERKNLEKRIQDLNARFSQYTYTLATYKTDNMVSTRKAIVKAKPQDKEKDNTNKKE